MNLSKWWKSVRTGVGSVILLALFAGAFQLSIWALAYFLESSESELAQSVASFLQSLDPLLKVTLALFAGLSFSVSVTNYATTRENTHLQQHVRDVLRSKVPEPRSELVALATANQEKTLERRLGRVKADCEEIILELRQIDDDDEYTSESIRKRQMPDHIVPFMRKQKKIECNWVVFTDKTQKFCGLIPYGYFRGLYEFDTPRLTDILNERDAEEFARKVKRQFGQVRVIKRGEIWGRALETLINERVICYVSSDGKTLGVIDPKGFLTRLLPARLVDPLLSESLEVDQSLAEVVSDAPKTSVPGQPVTLSRWIATH